MKTLTLSIAGLAIVLLAVPAMGQTITIGTGTLQNTTYTWPTAYGNWYSGSRDQFLFQASELAAAGMPAANIASVAWDVVTPGGQALQLFEIKMGLTTAPDLSTGWVSTAWTTVYGPTTYQDVVGWNTHTLAAPFAWDGASNIVMEICFWDGASNYTTNGVVNQTATPFASVRNAHSDLAPSCGGTSVGTAYNQRPNTQFGFGAPPSPEYQVNQPGSSMTLDGVLGTTTTRAITPKCPNSIGIATFSSNVPGTLWEAAMTLDPLVPLSSGGIALPGPQIVNVNFASPTLFYLFGGPVPQLVPFSGYFSGAFSTGSFPGTVSIQQINLHPSMPGGFALSQGCQLNVLAFSLPSTPPIAGPTGDDSEVILNVGCVALYGRSFSNIHVESNGRLMFGGGITSWSPSVSQFATDAPSFGVWCDMNPSAGGTITINSPAAGLIDVAYNGVYYYGTTLPNTYNLQLNTGTNVVSIVGLNTLSVSTSQQLIGISGGNAVLATDPGPVNFSPGGTWTTGITSNSTDMIYMLGTEGTLTTGIARVDFFLNVHSNYNWVSF